MHPNRSREHRTSLQSGNQRLEILICTRTYFALSHQERYTTINLLCPVKNQRRNEALPRLLHDPQGHDLLGH